MRCRRPHSSNPKNQKPRPYCETTKCTQFHAHSFAVHGRGGALLHPRGLAAAQGFARRAMLAHTIKSQKSDLFLRKLCPLLVGACVAGPPTVRGNILWFAAAANTGGAMLASTIESQKSDLFLRKLCLLLVGACIAGPPTVRGQILGSAGTANAGMVSPALLRNHEIVLIITHALSRPIVGVGLCSTRKALRGHRALAGEQCSPLR